MAGKKPGASKRGGSKKVIEYDPLAWLDESSDDSAEPKEVSEEIVPESSASSESADNHAGYGFFDQSDDGMEPIAEPKVDEADAAKPAGYGFFDEPDSPAKADDPVDESPAMEVDDGAYGFFDAPGATVDEPWKDDDATIHLGAELSIRSVQQAHRLIVESLSEGFDPRIDAGDLQKIDSAGLQLIYSLHKTVAKTGQSIVWVRPSPLIDSRAQELGLPELLSAGPGDGESDAGYGFF